MLPYDVSLPQSVAILLKFVCVCAVVKREPLGKSLNVTRRTTKLTAPESACARVAPATSANATSKPSDKIFLIIKFRSLCAAVVPAATFAYSLSGSANERLQEREWRGRT